MSSSLLLIFHIIFALSIIALVLMQQEKGGGLIAGSGASQTLFGSQGSASFIARLTSSVGILFFFTCLGLNFLHFHESKDSLLSSSTSTIQQNSATRNA